MAESRLLALPRELRDYIYRLAVVADKPLIAYVDQQLKQSDESESLETSLYYQSRLRPGLPALAQTCRPVRHEVLAIFFAENIFVFNTRCIYAGIVIAWTDRVLKTREDCQDVRNVWLRCDLAPPHRPGPPRSTPKPGLIKISFTPSSTRIGGIAAVECEGELLAKCVCRIDRFVAKVNSREMPTTCYGSALLIAEYLEQIVIPRLRKRSAIRNEYRVCDTCGKTKRIC